MKKPRYQIEKVMNNNVILVVDLQNHQELILVGKGLGFGKKEKLLIDADDKNIEKSFHTFDKKLKEEYFELLSQLDEKVISICQEIIAFAEKSLGKLNEYLHIVLTDHVGFALERIRIGMEISNPFLYEIKVLYPQEFEIGQWGAEIIRQRLGIEISESEMGFIALYLQSARQNKTIKETVQDTRLLKEAVEIIENRLEYKINPEEPTYIRLINHLRLKINRVQEEKHIKNPVLDIIKLRFLHSFEIAREIAFHIHKSKGCDISEDELGFMAMHIERIRELAKTQ